MEKINTKNEQELFDKKNIILNHLDTSLIRNNFIKNLETNYEDFLTEFVNASKVKLDYGNTNFKGILSQSNGEADAINEEGKTLEYKLFMDTNTIKSMYLHTENIEINPKGQCIYTESKIDETWKASLLIKVFSKFSYEQLKKIDQKSKNPLRILKQYFEKQNFQNKEFTENTEYLEMLVKKYMDNLKKDKNVIYFIPYNISYIGRKTDEDFLKFICKGINIDLAGFLKYRKENTKKDTYICFMSQDNVVFLKNINNKFEFYDMVKTNESKIYSKIEKITNDWN